MTVKTANILMPKKDTDMSLYAVIACDQFTSQVDYWDSLKEEIGIAPSTFNMMFPEAYLEKVDEVSYIEWINKNINQYLKEGTIKEIGDCFILVDRETPNVKRRLGLMISIDLEDYTYQKGVRSPIRASEATIVERIPPRLKIRKDAPIEFPHILFLYDDKDCCITEELYKNKDKYEKLYDFKLNKNGGHIKGYKIDKCEGIIEQFNKLLKTNNTDLMFIVGDGNHSLATAKAHWDNLKVSLSEKERESHPARYALVEAINIYDEGIRFEPIHRVVFNASSDFVEGLSKVLGGESKSYIYCKKYGKKEISIPSSGPLTYKAVQTYIDEYLSTHKESSVDYIHDEDHLLDVANKNEGSIAICMPSLTKSDIFGYIANDDVLPRKSFSMGSAVEKRYYLESKKIIY